VLAAEHFLGFTGFDFGREIIEGARQLGINRFAGLCPLHEHSQIVEAALERRAQIAILLEPPAALHHFLRGGLVLPEVWSGNALFDPGELVFGSGAVKDGYAGRRRGAPDPRTCEADPLSVETQGPLQSSGVSR
jgi:hypothetical protein